MTVHESTAPAWKEGDGWRIAPEPEIAIGVMEGDPRYLLARARGARRLDDGRIVVADRGANRLRVYSPEGEHLGDIGGEGEGPGEFTRLNYFEVAGDTIIAFNLFWPAVSRFLPDGSFLGSVRISGAGMGGEGWGNLLPFGYLIDRGLGIAMSTADVHDAEWADGVNRFPEPLWRFSLRDSTATRIGYLPGREDNVERIARGVRHYAYPFAKSQAVATSGRSIYVAPTESFVIEVRDPSFALRRIIRRPFDASPTTTADLERWIEEWIEYRDPSPDEVPEYRSSMEDADYAPSMPALRSLTVDAEGNIWVEEWPGTIFRRGPYAVFDSTGRWLGRVELPPGLAAEPAFFEEPWLEIGSDYVLGVWEDEFGVDQVRLYGIEKP